MTCTEGGGPWRDSAAWGKRMGNFWSALSSHCRTYTAIRPGDCLDVHTEPWPIRQADAVVCINMVHIAPWSATMALAAGPSSVLFSEGVMILYGPYRRDGRHTAPSNP